jgi:hypothetical protein
VACRGEGVGWTAPVGVGLDAGGDGIGAEEVVDAELAAQLEVGAYRSL